MAEVSTEEPVKVFRCDHAGCNKSFKRHDYLTRHQLNHAAEKPYACHLCERTFARADVCQKHILRHKPIEEREPLEPKQKAPKRRKLSETTVSRVEAANAIRQPQASTSCLPNSSNPPLSGYPQTVHVNNFIPADPLFPPYHLPDASYINDNPFDGLPGPGQPECLDENGMNDIFSWLFRTTPLEANPSPEACIDTRNLFGGNTSGSLMALAHIAEDSTKGPSLPSTTGIMPASSADVPNFLQSSVFNTRFSDPSHHAFPSSRDISPQLPTPPSIAQAQIITDEIRHSMIDLFAHDPSIDLNVPAFCTAALQVYLELYFMHIDIIYPIIHRPTLLSRPGGPQPLVLLALICIGTAFAQDKSGFKIAAVLHSKIRRMIFDHVETNPRVEIHCLQAILLVNYFGHYFSSPTSHDVAQVFHSPSMMMAKFAGLMNKDPFAAGSVPPDHAGWTTWALAEERRRLGWAFFVFDTQNSALFRHALMIQCYDMKIDLPCPDILWRSPTAHSWALTSNGIEGTPSSFRVALRELASQNTIRADTSDFGSMILVHGLLSVSWTLMFRDMGDLSMVSEGRISGWKDSMTRAFAAWHDFNRKSVQSRDDKSFYWTSQPFAHFGTILLLTDTERVRALAGAPRVAGRTISNGERIIAHKSLLAWASSSEGDQAAWSALELLQHLFCWANEDRLKRTPSTPWLAYVTVLTLWAYSYVLEGKRDLATDASEFASGTTSDYQIDAAKARTSALSYIKRLLCAGRPRDLSRVQHKHAVAGVLAYTAHLIEPLDWGIMGGPYKMLIKLLGAQDVTSE